MSDTSDLVSPSMSEGQHRPDRRHAEAPVVGLTGARFGGAAGRRVRNAASPGEDSSTSTSGRDGEGPVIGLAGARFSKPSGRRRARPTPAQATDQDSQQRLPLQPVPAAPPAHAAGPEAEDSGEPAAGELPETTEWLVDEADWDGSEESYGLVRPYSWTKGRTTSRHDLAIEALISATGWDLEPTASPEHHTILQLCSTPRSVAEVAALLSVPLGVARVLLGDMAETGSVMVHRTAGTADGAPDLALMQRVLSCLQRL